MKELENAPYVKWLEESLKAIITFHPDSMALVALRDSDGYALTGYFQAEEKEMCAFVQHIQSDITMMIIEKNIGRIKELLEEEEEPDNDPGIE